jgi:ribosome-associated protein
LVKKAGSTPKTASKKSTTVRKVAKPAAAPRPPRAAASKTNKLPAFTAGLRKQVLAALDELKARDVKEIDVREKASFTDLLVIASGTSSRHVKSIADEVVKFSKRAGVMPLGVEGQREAEWVLVDLGDIVVHVMLPRIREFYGLERLWTLGDSDTEAMQAATA